MEQLCHIYTITCLPEGKVYVGQTQQYKLKDGTPYNYGVAGRWCDHVSSSKRTKTPLSEAIRTHGPGAFRVECVETIPPERADEREAYWIETLSSREPNGYNVKSYSRCKHRDMTTIANAFLPTATEIETRVIKRNGVPRIVYVYVTLPTEKKRVTFGQSAGSTYETAERDASAFVRIFTDAGIPVRSNDSYTDQVYTNIRITRFNRTMVAVYLTPEHGTRRRVCFGGKHSTLEEAYARAQLFIQSIPCQIIQNDLFKSQQQATTSSGEATSEEGK
jgi:hypothetical protein